MKRPYCVFCCLIVVVLLNFAACEAHTPVPADKYLHTDNNKAKQDRWDEVIKTTTEAIRLDPHDAWNYFNRGDAYCHKGDFFRAIENLNIGISLAPDNIESFYQLRGMLHYYIGEYDLAISDFSDAIQLLPLYSTLSWRAHLYSAKGELDLATEDHAKAKELGYMPF